MAIFQFISCFYLVLRWFQLFLRKVDTISQYFALFALSAKCRFQTSKGHKTSINDWQNMFAVLYRFLLLVSEEIAGLGFAQCQRLLQIRVDGVDLRLTPIASSVTSLHGGYMRIIQFLYSFFNSFSFFLRVSHVSCCQVAGCCQVPGFAGGT